MIQKNVALNIRLRNCLQTILELEEALIQSNLGTILDKEFAVIKDITKRLNSSLVDENDVQKIEEVTERFLEEIQQTLKINKIGLLSGSQLLQ